MGNDMTDTQLDTGTPQQQRKRRWVLIGITALFVVGAALYAVYAALVLSKREETDNAYVGGNVVDSTGSVVSHGDVWWSENGQLYALSGGARQWSPMLPDGREWASAGDEYGSQLVECVS